MFLNINKGISCLAFLSLVYTDDAIKYNKWKLFRIEGLSPGKGMTRFMNRIENMAHVRSIERIKDSLLLGVGPEVDGRRLKALFEAFRLKPNLLHQDIAKLIDRSNDRAKRSASTEFFDRYMDYQEMENFFSYLESSFPETIQRKIVGQSFQGRNISLFIISSPDSNTKDCQSQQPVPQVDRTKFPGKKLHKITPEKMGLHPSGALSVYQLQHQLQIRQQRQRYVDQRGRQPRRWRFPVMRAKLRMRRRSKIDPISNANATYNHIYLSSNILKNIQTRDNPDKPVIFIDAGAHSREWISPASALYLIQHVARTPSLSARFDWHVLPLANPDGYKFSWDSDRFWRKTRSKSTQSGCFGADINRNFDHRWGEVDTSIYPCSEHYGGPRANSEVETDIIKQIFIKERKRIKAYISLHNWGQEILHPYCHSKEMISDRDAELARVSQGMAKAILKSQGQEYKSGRAAVLLYPASGTSIDWAYDVMKVPYAYLFELRDDLGILGFLLPESLIKPTSPTEPDWKAPINRSSMPPMFPGSIYRRGLYTHMMSISIRIIEGRRLGCRDDLPCGGIGSA